MKIPSISSLFKAKNREAGWLAVGLARHGIYLVQVEFKGVRPRVVRCEYYETGTEPALQLARIKREAGLGAAVCTTMLAPGEYQMMLVNAPNVPDNELKAAVRWKIKDGLHYSIDDATVDVLKIPANKNRPDRSQSLYAIAASNKVIQKRISLFDQAGLELGVIDIPEAAQRNIAALFEQSDHALAVLAFDDQGGLLTFTSGGALYLSRRIEINAGQLCDANEARREQYRDRVDLELQRSLDYFDRQFNHLTISRVLLSAPVQSGLLAFLATTVGIAVEGMDFSQVMDISAVPRLADSEFVSNVLPTLGAALRQEVRAT